MKKPRASKSKPASLEMARIAARAAHDMKAIDVTVLKVEGLSDYADYLVIASGRSTRQAQSIAKDVQKALSKQKLKLLGVEGEREGNWILIDGGAVVVHVFYNPVREFYELERLWSDAKQVSWAEKNPS